MKCGFDMNIPELRKTWLAQQIWIKPGPAKRQKAADLDSLQL
jgi:hypothetical protein